MHPTRELNRISKRQNVLSLVSEWVINLQNNYWDSSLFFHNLRHTVQVLNGVDVICSYSDIDPGDVELLKIAAWAHDVGYIKSYRNNNRQSRKMALSILRKHHYPKDRIRSIINCIRACNHPQRPKNFIEEILCDANLIYFAASNFKEMAERLRLEWSANYREFSPPEMRKIFRTFFKNHKYRTLYGQEVLAPLKHENFMLYLG